MGPGRWLSWLLTGLRGLRQYGAWWMAILVTSRPEQTLGLLEAPEELVVGPGRWLSWILAGLSRE